MYARQTCRYHSQTALQGLGYDKVDVAGSCSDVFAGIRSITLTVSVNRLVSQVYKRIKKLIKKIDDY